MTKRATFLLIMLATTGCGPDRSMSPTPAQGLSDPHAILGTLQKYVVIPMDLPAGMWGASSANAINDPGVIVGDLAASLGRPHPIAWINNTPSFLAVPSGHYGKALGINNRGDIVGYVQIFGSTDWQPVRWINSLPELLPTVGSESYATDINERRIAVGSSGGKAAMWRADGTLVVLHPRGATTSRADGVNDDGVISGTATFGADIRLYQWHASDGMGVDRGSVIVPVTDINNSGDVVATISQNGQWQPAWWSPSGQVLPIGNMVSSLSSAVSNARRVVVSAAMPFTAILGQAVVPLPEPKDNSITGLEDVNLCGTIVGWADGPLHAYKFAVRWVKAGCDPLP